jgi:two-component system, OmpR family, response regulator VicR
VKVSNVLIVDDDPGIARLLRITLQLDGHLIITARDGREALALYEAERPDIIVLDLQMPVMDGRQFFRAIDSPTRPPVIILSAYGAAGAQDELGAEGALPKPFEPNDLARAINDLSGSIALRHK